MFCVFYIDIEGSTRSVAKLRPENYSVYYATFYDKLSVIATKFGGRVIKHVGDALIIYFPATSDPQNRIAFKLTLDCGMEMLDSQVNINKELNEQGLPSLSYRISADYGRMEPIETSTSPNLDWIGPSMNMVSKMNRLAQSDGMVIGGDLHQIISKQSFPDYLLEFAAELDIGFKQKYPVYSIARRPGNPVYSSQSIDGSLTVRGAAGGELGARNLTSQLTNVLIVDDEPDILQVYKRYLSSQPINVDVFSDPMLLLTKLGQVGPDYYDLAILDVKMPKVSGLQVYHMLTALKPNIKTLFVSALNYADEVIAGVRGINGDVDLIRKPISRNDFVCAIGKKLMASC